MDNLLEFISDVQKIEWINALVLKKLLRDEEYDTDALYEDINHVDLSGSNAKSEQSNILSICSVNEVTNLCQYLYHIKCKLCPYTFFLFLMFIR